MDFIKDFQEVCLDKITITGGPELEMTANITSPSQFDLMLMGNVYGRHGLRSRYFQEQRNLMLRLTCSYQGRCRSDIVEIGKSQKIGLASGWNGLNGGPE
jgi:hypothetical protein